MTERETDIPQGTKVSGQSSDYQSSIDNKVVPDQNDRGTQLSKGRPARDELQEMIASNFLQLAYDVVEPARVITARLINSIVFLGSDALLFLIFELLSQNSRTRMPFLDYFLDGCQAISIIVISIYFLFDTLVGLLELRMTNKEIK